MRAQLLLAVTTLSLACFTVACSDDEPTTPGTTDDAGADTNVAIDSEGVDTSVIEDSGGIMPMDTGPTADAPAADTAPADTGSAADTFVPPTDGGLPGSVRIHEVYIDRNLEGDRVEFIELSGAPGTPIGTLWIRALRATGTPDWKLRVADTGAVIPPSGYWVIGTVGITNVNKVYSLTEFGLDNAGGSIQLTNDAVSATTLIDALGYGSIVAMASTDPKQTTEGTAATIPASGSTGTTIGRKSVPGDTNNNATDFCIQAQTPGAANGPCL